MSRLPVKLTEHGTKVTFDTTCLHNGIVVLIYFLYFHFSIQILVHFHQGRLTILVHGFIKIFNKYILDSVFQRSMHPAMA